MKLGIKNGKLKIKSDTPKGLRAVSCGCCGPCGGCPDLIGLLPAVGDPPQKPTSFSYHVNAFVDYVEVPYYWHDNPRSENVSFSGVNPSSLLWNSPCFGEIQIIQVAGPSNSPLASPSFFIRVIKDTDGECKYEIFTRETCVFVPGPPQYAGDFMFENEFVPEGESNQFCPGGPYVHPMAHDAGYIGDIYGVTYFSKKIKPENFFGKTHTFQFYNAQYTGSYGGYGGYGVIDTTTPQEIIDLGVKPGIFRHWPVSREWSWITRANISVNLTIS